MNSHTTVSLEGLPRHARAAILMEQKKDLLYVEDLELPTQLDIGQVLVKVLYSGICGSQLGEIDGAKGEDRYLPHLLGHEGTGIVQKVGPGVKHVKEGQSVVLHWRKGLGIEANPAVYQWRGQKINSGWITTFNEYAVVSENRLTPLPEGADPRAAILYGCAVTTGFGAIVNNAHLTIGESIVVFGAGGVGLNMVQAASMLSADPIIAVDIHDNKLELAQKIGATHTINATSQDAIKAIETILNGRHLDVFVDNTGNPSVIEAGYKLVSSQGRLVLVGVPRKDQTSSFFTLPLHFGKTVVGSHGGEAIPHEDIPRYAHLASKGKLDLDTIITREYDLSKINEAIHDMRSGALSGRCVINLASR